MPISCNLPPVLILLALAATPVAASAFFPGTVSGVPSGQSLAVRKLPSPTSLQLGSANNGDSLSMTGRCRRLKQSGALQSNFRIDVPSTPAKRAAKMSQPRTWCEVWFEVAPSDFQTVWARGSFITPG